MYEDNKSQFEEKDYSLKEAISILSEARMYESLKEAVKKYGLEGTEEIIKNVYSSSPKLKEKMLEALHYIWKGK